MKLYKAARRCVLAFVPFRMPERIMVAPGAGGPDYIIWGVIDWHFRHQRPQQLARKLADAGRRVFYISSNFQDDVRAGFSIEALDSRGRLFQVKLFVRNPPVIYFVPPSAKMVEQLRASIGQLLLSVQAGHSVSFVQHSFWYDIARVIPNTRLVYDCIDNHEGFGNNSMGILSLERRLLAVAELTVTSSAWLDQFAAKFARNRALIRNACDFEHFSNSPEALYVEPESRRIIGYYGAIANWFDLDLVESIALRFSDCCVLLVGADTVEAQIRLAHLTNVVFVGEVAYDNLPFYLYAFDVAILPFKVIPLTLATNPVKVYEYLAAGKPVVSVNLPEMSEFNGLVRVADSTDGFLSAIADIQNCGETQISVKNRNEFAREQTWWHRTQTLLSHTERTNDDPLVSIIVVTYNNLELTRACLHSIGECSDYPNIEIVVVDNASGDGTKEFLKHWLNSGENRKLILNDTNKGFAAANNQGLSISAGEYLVLLNNDTFVTPGWLRTLSRHLRHDGTIGLIGPVTNNIGNEARINIYYQDMTEMLEVSRKYTHSRLGKILQLPTIAFFCVMMRREVYEVVGSLDEIFGLGFFEDDDYCRRVEKMGLRIVCAEDVFVHHHHSASFLKLKREIRRALFDENRLKYEAKWGPWIPHSSRRRDAEYGRK